MRRCSVASGGALIVLVVARKIFLGTPFNYLAVRSSLPKRALQRRGITSLSQRTTGRFAESPAVSTPSEGLARDSRSRPWAKRALLISSFPDGVERSPKAQAFLKYSLACALVSDLVKKQEDALTESVRFSPCAGPDIDALNALEFSDKTLAEVSLETSGKSTDETADDLLNFFVGSDAASCCRILYIPTAMYALNPNSKNTPGKQRQRARADGKKRRNAIARQVGKLLGENIQVLAVTLDLDDGSVKQPVGSDDASLFPTNGREALGDWSPHLVYVEGGNTFWLAHCVEKGEWEEDLIASCTGPNAAVYCGKSAGAILAGAKVETATWKGWDDPGVVPVKQTYGHWKGHRGLCFAGDASFFPHMSEEFTALVDEKMDQFGDDSFVYCLKESEACCVDGNAGEIFLVTGE